MAGDVPPLGKRELTEIEKRLKENPLLVSLMMISPVHAFRYLGYEYKVSDFQDQAYGSVHPPRAADKSLADELLRQLKAGKTNLEGPRLLQPGEARMFAPDSILSKSARNRPADLSRSVSQTALRALLHDYVRANFAGVDFSWPEENWWGITAEGQDITLKLTPEGAWITASFKVSIRFLLNLEEHDLPEWRIQLPVRLLLQPAFFVNESDSWLLLSIRKGNISLEGLIYPVSFTENLIDELLKAIPLIPVLGIPEEVSLPDTGDDTTGQSTTVQLSGIFIDKEMLRLDIAMKRGADVPPAQELSASFTMDPPGGEAPLEVSFDATASDGEVAAYEWDFGDSESDTGAVTTHNYSAAGTYSVRLTIVGTEDARDTVAQEITVSAAASQVAAPDPPNNVSAEAGDSEVRLQWDEAQDAASYNLYRAEDAALTRENATPVEGVSSPHVDVGLTNGVTYYYALTTVAADRESELSAVVAATPQPAEIELAASFSLTPAGGRAPLEVDFDASASRGSISSYSWDFGDEAGGEGATSSHVYTAPGEYTVTLTVAGDNNSDSTTATLSVSSDEQDLLAIPDNLVATAQDSAVQLNWTAVEGALSYKIFWSTEPLPLLRSNTFFAVSAPEYSHENLANGTTYYYAVSAVFPGGESAESPQASATPAATRPALAVRFTSSPPGGIAPLAVTFDAAPSSLAPGADYDYRWDFGDGQSAAGEKTEHLFTNPGSFNVTLTVSKADGEAVSASGVIAVRAAGALPPDPKQVAPVLARTVGSDLGPDTAFLYSDAEPVQPGVAPGVIDPLRVAVIRGRVLDQSATPIAGVRVSILEVVEFGSTLTRADGWFDLAINGGAQVTLAYDMPGYLPLQRQLYTPWRDYVMVPDVVLVRPATALSLTLDEGRMAVARGEIRSDASGERCASLLFPPGLALPQEQNGGKATPLQSIDLSITEYTVGSVGSAAMPAQLPPNSAYTYAVELTALRANGQEGQDIVFDQPLPFYVENFLDFPPGTRVPVGYYDRVKACWLPEEDGLIVRILGVQDGSATLDVSGSGKPGNVDALAKLNIGAEELRHLGELYQPGQSLWRVPIRHFSTYDFNWPFGLPDDASDPNTAPPQGTPPEDKPCKLRGSILELQSQVMREAISLPGTGLQLYYHSDRVAGNLAAHTLNIPLSAAKTPQSLKAIRLEVAIAGQKHSWSYPGKPNQVHTFTWDGLDGYGRRLQGPQQVKVRVGYAYDGVYRSPEGTQRSFAQFAASGSDNVELSQAREEIILWREWMGQLGTWDTHGLDLGGWTLDAHHVYHPSSGVLYLGDGRRSTVREGNNIITTVVGTGEHGFSGDGGPASEAQLNRPRGIAFGPDGSMYIADTDNHRVRQVRPDGTIITLAGREHQPDSKRAVDTDDYHGPSLEAWLDMPHSVAVAREGAIYVSDYSIVRKIENDSDRTLSRVAGISNVVSYEPINGGPATEGQMIPMAASPAPDGRLWIGDVFNFQVRIVGHDGVIESVVNGEAGVNGDGSTPHQLEGGNGEDPLDLAIGPDGSVYYTDCVNSRVCRIMPDRSVVTIAGSGRSGFSGDHGRAPLADLNYPGGVTLAPDGTVYIADTANHRIRRVLLDGTIETVAGHVPPEAINEDESWESQGAYAGDRDRATNARLSAPYGIAFAPDGSLYIADTNNHCIRRLIPALAEYGNDSIAIASESGNQVFIFDGAGRHLETRHSLSGALLYKFSYDEAGRLNTVQDGRGGTVRIERDQKGRLAGFTGLDGARSTVVLNADDLIEQLTDPAGYHWQFGYAAGGLLTSFTDRAGQRTTFEYDSQGRLKKETNPAGGVRALARSYSDSGYQVKVLSVTGRESTYKVDTGASGSRRENSCCGRGGKSVVETDDTGRRTISYSDGLRVSTQMQADSRFGMQAPFYKSVSFQLPSGLTAVSERKRSVKLARPGDPFSLVSLEDKLTVNGRTSLLSYDAASRRLRVTSPEGRETLLTFDAAGRIVEGRRPGQAGERFGYDEQQRITSITIGSGANAIAARATYGADGRLATLIGADGNIERFSWDKLGRLSEQLNAAGQAISYSYDGNGNITSTALDGQLVRRLEWNPVNLLAATTPIYSDRDGQPTRYEYDADKRLVSLNRPGASASYAYDQAGSLERITHPHGEIAYSYDEQSGKLNTVAGPGEVKLSYRFDGHLLTEQAWDGPVRGHVTRTYNNRLLPVSLGIAGREPVASEYDGDALLIKVGAMSVAREQVSGFVAATTLARINDNWRYDDCGRLVSYSAGFDNAELYSFELLYDKVGRISSKKERLRNAEVTSTYSYDAAGKLLAVQRGGATVTYSYDERGNRTSSTAWNARVDATYDDQGQLVGYGKHGYEYSPNGELRLKRVGGQQTQYTYDMPGNLLGVKLPDGHEIAYVVDGSNRRIGKRLNGDLVSGWLYGHALGPIAELDGQSNVVSEFVYATRATVPSYIMRGGKLYSIIADHLGSPRLVVDAASGVIVQEIEYDAFGNVLNDSNPGWQPFGFAGGLYEPLTGLVRFGARDYDPLVGRWTAREPLLLPDMVDFYSYADGDPVNFVDPLGNVAIPHATILLLLLLLTVGIAAADCLRSYGSRIAEAAEKVFPDEMQDRQRHCWVNCMYVRMFGGNIAPATILSMAKELGDLLWHTVRLEFDQYSDSIGDMLANQYGQAAAADPKNRDVDCADICKNCPEQHTGSPALPIHVPLPSFGC